MSFQISNLGFCFGKRRILSSCAVFQLSFQFVNLVLPLLVDPLALRPLVFNIRYLLLKLSHPVSFLCWLIRLLFAHLSSISDIFSSSSLTLFPFSAASFSFLSSSRLIPFISVSLSLVFSSICLLQSLLENVNLVLESFHPLLSLGEILSVLLPCRITLILVPIFLPRHRAQVSLQAADLSFRLRLLLIRSSLFPLCRNQLSLCLF